MSSNTDATTRLLDGLVTLELLEKTKQGDLWLYNNTTIANKFLTRSSLESLVDYAALNNKTGYPMFANLASAVREGTPQWMKTLKVLTGSVERTVWKRGGLSEIHVCNARFFTAWKWRSSPNLWFNSVYEMLWFRRLDLKRWVQFLTLLVSSFWTREWKIVFCVEELLEANNMTGLRDRCSLRPWELYKQKFPSLDVTQLWLHNGNRLFGS